MNYENITILGGGGYIGGILASTFKSLGHSVWTPKRGDSDIFLRDLGVVYYCIGLTSDFRTKPYDTIDAHIGLLKEILKKSNFDKLIYLSSTRVYINSTTTNESQPLMVNPNVPSDLYNISKIMGESLSLSSGKNCVIARLSNVVGPGMGGSNFIGLLLEEAVSTRKLCFHTGENSEKDYIWIDDVIRYLVACKDTLPNSIYNIASGFNINNSELANIFSCLDIDVTFAFEAPTISFPVINNKRFVNDTGYDAQNSCLNRLKDWISSELKQI